MASSALALDNTWQNQTVSGLLRQQKMAASIKQANAQRLQSQISNNTNLSERHTANQTDTTTDDNSQSETATKTTDQTNTDNPINSSSDTAESLKAAQQLAKLAANPTPAGVATLATEQAMEAMKSGEAAKLATGQLLKQYWLNLISSWGATLIAINLHAWLGFLEGNKIFCKLGEEWNKVPGAAKKAVGQLEFLGMVALDLIVFIVILTAISIIITLINMMTNPVANMQVLWDLFGGQLDGLLKQ